MKKLATDLTEKEMEIFEGVFYDICFIDDRDGNPLPWGCPWFWECGIELQGKDIEEMAINFYKTYKKDIFEATR